MYISQVYIFAFLLCHYVLVQALAGIHILDVADVTTTTKSSLKKKEHHEVENTPPSCCKNGGQCILSSFCICPKNFYGRYCEHEIHFRNCRHVPHGYWIRSDCDLCRCYDGNVICVPHMFDGCGKVNLTSEDMKEKIDPFKGKKIDIAAPSEGEQIDQDYMYQKDLPTYNVDDYYYADDIGNLAHVTSGSLTSLIFSYLLVFIVTQYFES